MTRQTTLSEPSEEATITDQPPTTEVPVHTEDMDWIPTAPGKSFRPLRFGQDGWSELMRLEPGSGVALHRHTGEVHAFNLSGTRQILDTDELLGPGDYVYEPAGTVDAWHAVGESPCIVHIKVIGAVEYLGASGQIVEIADSASQQAAYLAWCQQRGVQPAPQILNRQDPGGAASPPAAGQP